MPSNNNHPLSLLQTSTNLYVIQSSMLSKDFSFWMIVSFTITTLTLR